jgi:hypothetical protein
MKTALCFWGEPREIQNSYKGIYDNLIEPNNVTDIFCHFWHDQTRVGQMYSTTRVNGDTGPYRVPNLFVKADTPALVYQLYNPTACLFEKYRSWPIDKYIIPEYACRHMIPTSQSMFYSIKQSFSLLKSTNKTYDYIISCRPDVILKTPINVAALDSNVFHSNTECGHSGGVNDWIGISNQDNMFAYARIFDEIDILFGDGYKMIPELLIGKQLRTYGIKNQQSFNSEGLLR